MKTCPNKNGGLVANFLVARRNNVAVRRQSPDPAQRFQSMRENDPGATSARNIAVLGMKIQSVREEVEVRGQKSEVRSQRSEVMAPHL
jgi:hypothetical protein